MSPQRLKHILAIVMGGLLPGGQFSASGGDVNELAPGNGLNTYIYIFWSFVVSGSMDGTKNGELLLDQVVVVQVMDGGGGAGGIVM